MKRLLSMILACALICSAFTACGGKLSKEEKVAVGEWEMIAAIYEGETVSLSGFTIFVEDDFTFRTHNTLFDKELNHGEWKYDSTSDNGSLNFTFNAEIDVPVVIGEHNELGLIMIWSTDNENATIYKKVE